MMQKKYLRIFPMLFIALQSSCFFTERQISDDFAGFEVVSGQEKTNLLQEIYKVDLQKYSLASSVKIENSLSTRSFEQVLLVEEGKFRSTWYAPNYIQTLAFLINDKKEKLYCDITTLKCWLGLPKGGEMRGLESVIGIEGLGLARLMTGLPPEEDFYNEISIRKNKKINEEYLVEFENDRLAIIAKFVRLSSKDLKLVEMFISENNDRIAEIDWSYSDLLDKIPESTIVNFLNKGFKIELKTKKFSLGTQQNHNVFELLVPDGFEVIE